MAETTQCDLCGREVLGEELASGAVTYPGAFVLLWACEDCQDKNVPILTDAMLGTAVQQELQKVLPWGEAEWPKRISNQAKALRCHKLYIAADMLAALAKTLGGEGDE